MHGLRAATARSIGDVNAWSEPIPAESGMVEFCAVEANSIATELGST